MSTFGSKKQIANQADFASSGKVSVWIGDFDDEMALLDYVEADNGMGADFGCVLRSHRELAVEPRPKPLRELLEGFSWPSQFVEEIIKRVGEDTRSHCAVVAHASDYSLLGITPAPKARLRFVGVASFGGGRDA